MKVNEHNRDLLARVQEFDRSSKNSLSDASLVPDDEEFVRLDPSQRIQHIVLIVCFSILALTGLPVLFPDAPLVHTLFFFDSSFWLRGILHRVAGVALIGLGIFRIGYIILSPRGNDDIHKMLPEAQDAKDAIGQLLYNLGIRKDKPRFSKFSVFDKFEFWAVVWGIIIMAATGLMLWFHEAAIALFPIWVLDIVRLVHRFEAILAILAIAIWHMYNVFLKPEIFPMNRVWITGKVSKKEMMERHPLEYEAILSARREEVEIERVRTILGEVKRHRQARRNATAKEVMKEEHAKSVI